MCGDGCEGFVQHMICYLVNLGVVSSDSEIGDDSMLQYSLNDVRYTFSWIQLHVALLYMGTRSSWRDLI